MITTIKEHQKIIDLLEKRDEENLEALLRTGLEAVECDLTASFENK
jgi:DNA-binding GntR family transcriptional regulator